MITREACKAYGIDLSRARVAVQGFGNVGSWAAKLLAQLGATVVAVSDVRGGILRERGLDLDQVLTHCKATGSVVDMKGPRAIDNEELLHLDVEILVPAALGGVITRDNADDIQARLIVEAANSPVTPRADEVLGARNIPVVPDILANAGGVTVSYFEWVQNLQQFNWSHEKVNRELEARMTRAWHAVYGHSREGKIPLRLAAYADALDKLAEATRQRF